ncbi:signal transducing kinase of the PAK [Physocladia obscura]|uniref:Signal transducing kinase of the PAK n=1 Tax=Physocladia obscura TaxID=109957 RepID=A0AAD5SPC8_9FUNG|nr:signal transducing kinase of the PAK [Physocladia obscura]
MSNFVAPPLKAKPFVPPRPESTIANGNTSTITATVTGSTSGSTSYGNKYAEMAADPSAISALTSYSTRDPGPRKMTAIIGGGLPKEWQTILQAAGISKQDQDANPQAMIDIIGFYNDKNAGKLAEGVWEKFGKAEVSSSSSTPSSPLLLPRPNNNNQSVSPSTTAPPLPSSAKPPVPARPAPAMSVYSADINKSASGNTLILFYFGIQ